MPVPPVLQETPEESNSGFKLEPKSPVASLQSMKACKANPNDAHLPPIVVDFERENKASTSNAVFNKKADGSTGDSSNGNKSSSSRKPSGKNNDTIKEELIARLVSSDEIIQTMRKDQENMNRRVSFLRKENEKLIKNLTDSLQQADAERTRADDVYEKFSKTITLFNKVGKESTTQRFFKEKHYEESLQKIKTEIHKKVKERQELRSIVRTFSTALGMFVELDGADEKLGLLGESVTQTYKDAMKDNTNEPKELDVAKKIAKVDDEEMNEGGA
ncbi:unnamed protein product [Orchesella dallaii]|uniref:Uncharacterized protein n=1 Tax=Orchesella dallaii TaxID=48710 RepID=A0ABP1PJD8_9HEXA